METPPVPRIFAIDSLNDGVVIKFDDGTCAFYSADLLYKTIPLAEMQDEKAEEW